jgi:hypothetical protein
MAVYYIEGSMLMQNGFDLPRVFDRISHPGAGVDFGSERTYLVIVRGFFTRVDQKMKLELRSINAP